MHFEMFHNLLSSRDFGTLNCGTSLRERRTAVRWRFRRGTKTRVQVREMTVFSGAKNQVTRVISPPWCLDVITASF